MQNKSLAFIFPGQGSQSIGMMNDLAASYPQVRQTFDEASQSLGFDLWTLVSNGPEEQLNKTENTQPAMLAADMATWRVWRSAGGPLPAFMAGHSLGEYSALCCAEVLDFAAAVRLVADRGRYMQEAVPEGEGGMAAIVGLDDDQIHLLCSQQAGSEILAAANYNTPGQVVIAGHATAVARGVEGAKAMGAKLAVMLAVSVPSHCALMAPAAERLAARLNDITIKPPLVPVLHNATARAETGPRAIYDALIRQASSPVRWVETIRAMTAQGIDKLVECGPGKVLSGLNKRINRDVSSLPIHDRASLLAALTAVGVE